MRFAFGENWSAYAERAISDDRIEQARADFARLFDGIPLAGRRFLDIGFGQGLSLTVAREMGAEVKGIDIDPDNVGALEAVTRRMGHATPPPFAIGSVLDDAFMAEAAGGDGYDVVHSWGVLHHTGDMRRAIASAAGRVRPGGHLVIAIYNRHWSSPLWTPIKRLYNLLPRLGKCAMEAMFFPVLYLAKWAVTGRNPLGMDRGMDFHHNLVDWIGGYPYEYASAEEIGAMVAALGFECVRVIPAQVPTGCNEFVFRRLAA